MGPTLFACFPQILPRGLRFCFSQEKCNAMYRAWAGPAQSAGDYRLNRQQGAPGRANGNKCGK